MVFPIMVLNSLGANVRLKFSWAPREIFEGDVLQFTTSKAILGSLE